jgi:hypothetical protein
VRVFDATGSPPNRLLPFALHDVRYYSDSLLPRYRDVIRDHALGGRVTNQISVMSATHYPGFDHRVLAALGVAYYVVRPGVRPVAGHRRTHDPSLHLDPEHFPRAYVVHEASFGVGRDESLGRLVNEPASLREAGLVEERRPATFPELGREGSADPVNVVEYGFNRVVIDASTDAPGLLILLDQHYPGWRVSVNGELADVLRVNHLFRGVGVGAGQSRVVFEYAPASFRYGLWLSAAAAIAAATWLARVPGKRAPGRPPDA